MSVCFLQSAFRDWNCRWPDSNRHGPFKAQRILSPLRLPFRHIGAASMILTGFYRAPKAICYPVHEYLCYDFTSGYWLRDEIITNFMTLRFVFRPFWRTFLVKGGNPLASFVRFAGLHVVLQRDIDIFFH